VPVDNPSVRVAGDGLVATIDTAAAKVIFSAVADGTILGGRKTPARGRKSPGGPPAPQPTTTPVTAADDLCKE
jgi:hypothetical protein